MKKLVFALCLSAMSLSTFASPYICYSLESSRQIPHFTFIIENEEASTDADGNAMAIRPVRIFEIRRDQELNAVAVGKASLEGIRLNLLQEGDIVVGEIKARPAAGFKNVLEGTIKLQGLAGGKARPIGCQKGK